MIAMYSYVDFQRNMREITWQTLCRYTWPSLWLL